MPRSMLCEILKSWILSVLVMLRNTIPQLSQSMLSKRSQSHPFLLMSSVFILSPLYTRWMAALIPPVPCLWLIMSSLMVLCISIFISKQNSKDLIFCARCLDMWTGGFHLSVLRQNIDLEIWPPYSTVSATGCGLIGRSKVKLSLTKFFTIQVIGTGGSWHVLCFFIPCDMLQ